MQITRRDWLTLIGTTLLVACRGPAAPPQPQTVTFIIDGMT
jgi:hypothetical protein